MSGSFSPAIIHSERKRPRVVSAGSTSIERFISKAMCSRIGTIVKQQNGVVRAIKLTCRSWSCPDCAKDRRKRVILEAKEGAPQRFITLTVNPNWFDSPEERARRLVAAWRLVRRRFLKLHKNAIVEFMAVMERTKLGEPHLHIVQRGAFISQKWLSGQMAELIGAKIVDIRFIRSQAKVAEYVSKYLGKDPFQFGNLKRYWRSRHYLKMTNAEKKRLRNAGAVFFILENHWKGYLRWLRLKHSAVEVVVGRAGFEFAWPDERAPPLCVTEPPLGA